MLLFLVLENQIYNFLSLTIFFMRKPFIDIINDKIWVQEDATDYDIVGVLEDEHHIPKSDIVLAFYAPYRRPHTGYAVA
jgi:hypothetical protein